jgi:hypothetical protein
MRGVTQASVRLPHEAQEPVLRSTGSPSCPYSPNLVEVVFSELRLYGVLGSSHRALVHGIMLGVERVILLSPSGRKEEPE